LAHLHIPPINDLVVAATFSVLKKKSDTFVFYSTSIHVILFYFAIPLSQTYWLIGSYGADLGQIYYVLIKLLWWYLVSGVLAYYEIFIKV
jgi:hypothetical protein